MFDMQIRRDRGEALLLNDTELTLSDKQFLHKSIDFSLCLEDGMACSGRHLAVADSEKRLHVVDVSRNFFRRVTYDSDWPITLAEQAQWITFEFGVLLKWLCLALPVSG